MGIQTRSSVKSDSSNCFGPCFYPQRECFGPIVYSDPGIDSRRCTREERSVQALSLLGTRDTAIINTSTQPRTKIFAGVRGTRTRPRCTSAFTPSARVRGPWMHSRLVLLRSLAMVNVVLLLPLRSLLPRGSHFSLLRAMCTNGSDALILSLSLSLFVSLRSTLSMHRSVDPRRTSRCIHRRVSVRRQHRRRPQLVLLPQPLSRPRAIYQRGLRFYRS